jgi:Xaa-Pro aminopeptidase
MNQFTSAFYENNRKKLCSLVTDTLIILPAHKMLQYSLDTPYSFRQESNFLYLSGIKEPDLTLIIDTANNECTLLYTERNNYQNEWDGEININKLSNISGIKKFESDSKLEVIVSKSN